MGVSGSGKSTVGRLLAERLGWDFWEGDDFHSAENKRKMASRQPLTDADRSPWLERLRRLIEEALSGRRPPAVLACSALRSSYREVLSRPEDSGALVWVFLKGEPELIRRRLNERSGHFMPPQLLESQFETLEEPESALVVDIDAPPATLVQIILDRLGPRDA